ncbi:FAD-dependent monooxygenase [Streptomyces sp. tea 10]|nr:FAD-dependent monooxygenase [Streptomyces sp. tea 10]
MIGVVAAGAGPTGLMLACEPSLAGARPPVLERRTEPSGEHRANGLAVVLLDLTGTLDAGRWAPHVGTATLPHLETALLLRPDCYVAWPGTTGDGLHEALETWCEPVLTESTRTARIT